MEFSGLKEAETASVRIAGEFQDLPVRRVCASACAENKALQEVVIADSVINIGNSAFYYCSKLERVTLPSGLQIIEGNAFNSCTALRSVVIPEGTKYIGNRAFFDDRRLESVEIPDSVEFIGNKAFGNCPNLTIRANANSYAAAYAKQNALRLWDKETAAAQWQGDECAADSVYPFTLRSICWVAKVPVPEKFADRADVAIPAIKCFGNRVKTGDALILRGLYETGKPASRQYNEGGARKGFENGASFIFSKEQYYDSNGKELPCIVVSDPRELFIKLCGYVRDAFPAKRRTVAVTGSVGKTTTKDMLALVAGARYKTERSRENSNGFASIAAIMQRLREDTSVYVQEVGAYYPGLVEDDARILRPDACVVTNIGTSHIDLYGTVEGIMYDKLALARHMPENGMAFLNRDDARLRQADLHCNITWFSVDDPQADYHAENIRVYNDSQEFDVVGQGASVHVRLMNIGYHNIINAVSAVAFGRWIGVSDEGISKALEKYQPAGMRQNLTDIGGYRLFVDCFNSAPNSLEAAIKTIMLVEIPAGSKRIAVLGDMLKMGDIAPQLHTDSGRALAKYDVDLFLCYGPNMRYMAEELKKNGKNVYYTDTREQLNEWVKAFAKKGDLLLFKSGHRMYLSKTIDEVFGTAFYMTDDDIDLALGKNASTEELTGRSIEGRVKISKCVSEKTELTVPATIDGASVYRIGDSTFSRNGTLKKIVLPEGLSNIGFAAFYHCDALTDVQLPSSLKIIGRSAFNNCAALEEMEIPQGVTTIDRRAFYECSKLKRLRVGAEVAYIGPEAFAHCPALTVFGEAESYAEQYCRAEKIPFERI